MPPTDFLPAREIVLAREEAIPASADHEAAVAAHWRAALERNSSLFNGPLLSPLGVTLSDGVCRIRWRHSDFAHYLFSRQNPSHDPVATTGTLFVSVAIPTTDGRLVVGRMSRATSSPGLIQLPGGVVSVGSNHHDVSTSELTATAVQESDEELGITLDPGTLRISGVIRRHRPLDVGVVFLAEPRSWDTLKGAFDALRAQELRAGGVPEFDELLTVAPGVYPGPTPGEPGGGPIDYLAAVVRALVTTGEGVA